MPMPEHPAHTDPCRRVVGWLPLLVGGELRGDERRRAERHLIGCPDCRGALAAHRRALAALHAAGQVDPISLTAATPTAAALRLVGTDRPAAGPDPTDLVAPPGSIWPALARQIREAQTPGGPAWAWSDPRSARPWRWALAGLAAGVLLIAGGGGLWSLSHQYRLKVSLVPVKRPSAATDRGPLASGSDLSRLAPPAYRRPIDGAEPPATVAAATPDERPDAAATAPGTPTN